MKIALPDQKKKTFVTFVLDDSGSMSSVRQPTLSGFNEQLQAVKNMESADHEVYLSVILFGDPGPGIRMVRRCIRASEMAPLTLDEYTTAGASTALLDAMNIAIDHLNGNDALHIPGNAALMVTMTDGQNNSSRVVPNTQFIKNKINGFTALGNWTFTFMGVGNVDQISGDYGISRANVTGWQAGVAGAAINTMSTSKGLHEYAMTRNLGGTAVHDFYSKTAGEEIKVDTDFSVSTGTPVQTDPSSNV